MAPWSNGREERRKARSSAPCWRISSFTMSSIYGCAGNIPTSPSNDMPTTLPAIAEAKHKRLNCVRRLKRCLQTANYNCIRKDQGRVLQGCKSTRATPGAVVRLSRLQCAAGTHGKEFIVD